MPAVSAFLLLGVGVPRQVVLKIRFEDTPLPADSVGLQLADFNNPASGPLRYVKSPRHSGDRKSFFVHGLPFA
jgi:hypothetical protein